MNTKGFLLLLVTVVVIGGSIGGAFAGGLALGRSQSDDSASESAIFQPQFGGGQFPSGGLQGGRLSGNTSDGPSVFPPEDSSASQGGITRPGDGAFGDRGGFGGFVNGTVGVVDDNGFSVSTQTGETQVTLDENSVIQVYTTGTEDDLSLGASVSVTVSGDAQSGEAVNAVSVILNPPEGGGGGFRGQGGLSSVVSGIIGTVEGNGFSVTTDSGQIQVILDDDSTIQIYAVGTADDISSGDQVLVIVPGDVESGEPVPAAVVIVNPPLGGGIFGGGGFGGRRRGP